MLAAGFLEHPGTQRHDDAAVLGGGDESAAGTSPRVGCSQRARTSTPTMCRVATSNTGW